jgi:uncharacterized protein
MVPVVLSADRARVVPWKNGLGTTTEYLVWPPGSSFEKGDFTWRLSAARVDTDGPFSSFRGCDRILTVTAGAGLLLEHAEQRVPVVARRLEPYAFSGDWSTSARLVAGPVVDFNVIWRREQATATVEAWEVDATAQKHLVPGSAHLVVHVLNGSLQVQASGGGAVVVPAGDTLWARGSGGEEELVLLGEPACTVLVVRVGN